MFAFINQNQGPVKFNNGECQMLSATIVTSIKNIIKLLEWRRSNCILSRWIIAMLFEEVLAQALEDICQVAISIT